MVVNEIQEKRVYMFLIGVGIVFRFYRLESFVPSINFISSRYVVLLNEILQGNHWFPRGPLSCEYDETLLLYLTLPIARLFGYRLVVFRATSAVFSLCLLPAMFYFVSIIDSRRSAWIATVFTSTSLWFIQSAHEYHRIRFDLGVACGLVAMALLLDEKKQVMWRGMGAGLLSGVGLYLHSSNAVLIICGFIILIIGSFQRKKNSWKLIAYYSLVGIVIFHSGWSLRDTSNIKSMHLLRFKSIREHLTKLSFADQHLKSIFSDAEDSITIQKTKKVNYPLIPPGKAKQLTTPVERLGRNIYEIPASLVWHPIKDYLRIREKPIHNPLLGFLVAIGFCLLFRCEYRIRQKWVIMAFLVWWPLQSLMRARPVETLYYNVGVAMSIAFSAITLTGIAKQCVRHKWRLVSIVLVVAVLGATDLVRTGIFIEKTAQSPSKELRLYSRLHTCQTIPYSLIIDQTPNEIMQNYYLLTLGLQIEYDEKPIFKAAVASLS